VLTPARVGAEDVLGGLPGRVASCGYEHTLFVTEEGSLWTCGRGEEGTLGLNEIIDRRVPTEVEA